MFNTLKKAKRFLAEVTFTPRQGGRFQPTGFADLGAATYQAPDGTHMLLVESAQSMANHLEATIAQPDGAIIPELGGIPYVSVKIDGAADTVTTSLIEAHRLNSPWIMSAGKADGIPFDETLRQEMGLNGTGSVDWERVARAIFKYDPNSLLHGTFLVRIDSRIKMARALSAFIEAEDVREVASGGTKFDHIDPTGKKMKPQKSAKEDVLGNIPFHRIEYTARVIKGYFNLDLGLLRGLGLSDAAVELLLDLSIYKIQRFLENGTRLRTACDLQPGVLTVTDPGDVLLPEQGAVLGAIKEMIDACKAEGLFADPPCTALRTVAVKPTSEMQTEANTEEDEA